MNNFSNSINYRQNRRRESNEEEQIYRRSVLITHKHKADEHIVLKHVEKLLNTLNLSNNKFQDETFPASSISLFINGSSLSQSTLDVLPEQQTNLFSNDQIQWLTPEQIHPPEWNQNKTNQWTVFRHPKPNDVLQGSLGDCWFITALSVLAEEPEYLMRVCFSFFYLILFILIIIYKKNK